MKELIVQIHPLLLTLLPVLLVGCRSSDVALEPPQLHQDMFYKNLAALQGDWYEGRAVYMIEPDSPFDGARLYMKVDSVERGVMRVPFHVEDDASRTWVFTLTNDGLHLLHDHRYPDGTPHDLTDYGGWAAPNGTSLTQSFPADEKTREMLPEASTNVWTMEWRPDEQIFIYDLQRHNRPRFRAEFDLSSPVQRDE